MKEHMTTQQQTDRNLTDIMWERHSNPLSAWLRILSFPLLLAPFWYESGLLAIAAVFWFVANPFIFPPPNNDHAWSTRGVLGERIWLEDIRLNADLLILALSIVAIVAAIVFALRTAFWPMMTFTAAAFISQLWYFDRMHFLYDRHAQARS